MSIRLTSGMTVITVHCIFTIWGEMPLYGSLWWMHWVLSGVGLIKMMRTLLTRVSWRHFPRSCPL